ncbi:hypothetical protein [Streptomyces venezuelae]|uniref:hypothetical protein n=1 Tax=Streptomyces venezuelae TaxID=54571 RepID=UPI0036638B42
MSTENPTPRETSLHLARRYADRALRLAQTAEERTYASSNLIADYATVSALYADIARTHAAIAQATPDDAVTED